MAIQTSKSAGSSVSINSTYPADAHNLQTLKGPVKDIAALNRALADPATGLFADADVALLPEATSARAIRALGSFFGQAARDDVLALADCGVQVSAAR